MLTNKEIHRAKQNVAIKNAIMEEFAKGCFHMYCIEKIKGDYIANILYLKAIYITQNFFWFQSELGIKSALSFLISTHSWRVLLPLYILQKECFYKVLHECRGKRLY